MTLSHHVRSHRPSAYSSELLSWAMTLQKVVLKVKETLSCSRYRVGPFQLCYWLYLTKIWESHTQSWISWRHSHSLLINIRRQGRNPWNRPQVNWSTYIFVYILAGDTSLEINRRQVSRRCDACTLMTSLMPAQHLQKDEIADLKLCGLSVLSYRAETRANGV